MDIVFDPIAKFFKLCADHPMHVYLSSVALVAATQWLCKWSMRGLRWVANAYLKSAERNR